MIANIGKGDSNIESLHAEVTDRITKMRKGRRECSDHDHLFLAFNNLNDVLCTDYHIDVDEGKSVFVFHTRPGALANLLKIYSRFALETSAYRDMDCSITVNGCRDATLTVRVIPGSLTARKQALSLLLDSVNQFLHETLMELIKSREVNKRDGKDGRNRKRSN